MTRVGTVDPAKGLGGFREAINDEFLMPNVESMTNHE